MEVENEHAQERRGNPRSAPEFATATLARTKSLQVQKSEGGGCIALITNEKYLKVGKIVLENLARNYL